MAGSDDTRWEEAVARWRREVLDPTVERHGLRDGVPEADVVTPADVPGDPLEDLGLPGEFPFTRGVQPTMYRGRFWTMRQYSGFGTAEETNERFHYLLRQGQTWRM